MPKDKKQEENIKTEIPSEDFSKSSGDIDNMLDEITTDMPDVQQHAIDNEEQKRAEIKETFSDLKDSDGLSFSPQLHETDESGKPKLTKAGKLRKLRGQGAKKMKSKIADIKAEQEKTKNESQRKSVSLVATNATQQLGIFLGGDDARFITDPYDEKASIFEAYDNYFEAQGVSDIPPNLALVLAVGGYGFRVMTTKPARAKTKSIFYGIKAKFGNMFKSKGKKILARLAKLPL